MIYADMAPTPNRDALARLISGVIYSYEVVDRAGVLADALLAAGFINPSPIDLVQELRQALGLFYGAMAISPKEAWEEALDEVKRVVAASGARNAPEHDDEETR